MTAQVVPSSVSAEGHVRPLTFADLPGLQALLETDPVSHCFVAGRLEATANRALSDVWGYVRSHEICAALYVGANIVPMAADAAACEAFAERLLLSGRRGSSLVGKADQVLGIWRLIEGRWGRAREVRAHQPLLAIDHDSLVELDGAVRPVRRQELDALVPACVSMFTEEVGISPTAGGAEAAYRARIAELIAEGRALARIESGRVVFKAEVGAVSARACQIQGVWVAPDRRGQGLSVPGMAAVVHHARRTCAPVVSLYVNDYNSVARRCYDAVGFAQVGEFATVLF